ncbi:MGDG synthase family glycosyltransferase [Niallia sp. 01092]|uniref:MGDG synthase family glycosyltransferase n=1 Tax=unclassified Niallia TaxID=2837522 RepID=UPI003FD5D076
MKQAKNILFFPFLQIPSGHHQVANAIMEKITTKHPQIKCEKIDILSYSYGRVETFISKTYIKWIQTIPHFYNWIYQNSVYKNINKSKRYRLYELLFLSFMKKVIKEKRPDLIVCTHALPSYMVNMLKEKGELNTPVINIYTDYFIHRLWGMKNIDYHFIASHHMNEFLKQRGLKEEQIFMTGIPIHPKIKKQTKPISLQNTSSLSLLITGGNLGVGEIEELVNRIELNLNVKFFVLCGKNENLYKKIKQTGKSNIIPLKYIQCKDKMNMLYDEIDGIITKPGGVTISESLFKRKPIFIYHALPGQEIINVQQLKKLGVIFDMSNWKNQKQPFDQFIFSFFHKNSRLLDHYQRCISNYHKQLSNKEAAQIIEEILLKDI